MILALLALQASAPPPPDIDFQATVRARSLTIGKRGEASLVVHSDPPGNNVVDIRAPKAGGRKTIRNPEIKIHVQARLAAPDQETGSPD